MAGMANWSSLALIVNALALMRYGKFQPSWGWLGMGGVGTGWYA